MKVLYNEEEYDGENSYVALGSFDGLHKGHLGLINKVNELSNKNKCKSILFTFKNHPLSLIKAEFTPKLIMDNETKIYVLNKLKLDYVFLKEFDRKFSSMRPLEFILYLSEKFNVKGIIVGFNFRFGYENAGDVDMLKDICNKYHIELNIIDAVELDKDIISSSSIRKNVSDGNIEVANKYLFEPFSVSGVVIDGKKIGRLMGFPTANILLNESMVYPPSGIYYTNVMYENILYKSITNIGCNPTVNGKVLSFETHILDFSGNLYGKEIRVYFLKRLRDEQKFNNIDELKIQIEKDKKNAEKIDMMSIESYNKAGI